MFILAAAYAQSVAMTTVDLYARIRLRLAITLARDIAEYRNGDVSKLSRMVDGRGKQINTLQSHTKTIGNILEDERVKAAYPVTCRMLAKVEIAQPEMVAGAM